MRIAITGAQGVGKTTLANGIVKALPEYKLLPEAARLALDLGFKLDQNADVETELWLMAKQIELERQAGPWVADRCFIDLLVYIHTLFGDQPGFDFLIKLAETIAVHQMSKYDLVIYLPAGEFGIEADGVRNTDREFQGRIDRGIRDWLEHQSLPYTTIKGNPQERSQQVKRLIENYA